jgi:hypothetical protein
MKLRQTFSAVGKQSSEGIIVVGDSTEHLCYGGQHLGCVSTAEESSVEDH